ncbi:MAG TPA: hypothetical protein VMB73_23615 [Acetobacteraceae bacterium]|nr:hypothetical protein [Acetobacteraceae bacterium]
MISPYPLLPRFARHWRDAAQVRHSVHHFSLPTDPQRQVIAWIVDQVDHLEGCHARANACLPIGISGAAAPLGFVVRKVELG